MRRSTTNRVVYGVFGGFAESRGLSAVPLRIGFVVAVLLLLSILPYASALLLVVAYLVLAMRLPHEPTTFTEYENFWIEPATLGSLSFALPLIGFFFPWLTQDIWLSFLSLQASGIDLALGTGDVEAQPEATFAFILAIGGMVLALVRLAAFKKRTDFIFVLHGTLAGLALLGLLSVFEFYYNINQQLQQSLSARLFSWEFGIFLTLFSFPITAALMLWGLTKDFRSRLPVG